MIKIYEDNGLPFFDQEWLRKRQYVQQVVADLMTTGLRTLNRMWHIEQIEAPCLIPTAEINSEYDESDVFMLSNVLSLKPETTATSYLYANRQIKRGVAPPLCIWQASKSFRRENDQVSKNVRLKEFYQQEFQCIYTDGTKADYQKLLSTLLAGKLEDLLGAECRIVNSDRLPSYSTKTIDIEAKTPHKWLEVASISQRTDVPFDWNGKKLLNTEFAFGLDRLTYVMCEPYGDK